MNIPPEAMLVAIGMVVSAGVGWGAAKANVKGHATQLKALWDWTKNHDKESTEARTKFAADIAEINIRHEREMGALRERVAKKETQNVDILRRLDNIDQSIKTLAERRKSG